MRGITLCLIGLLFLSPFIASARAQLKTYDSPYYVIQTDLEGDDVKETVLRMTTMAQEYHNRTREFSGQVNRRLPFLLFKNRRDYMAAGGMPGSAGVFMGDKLMAVAGEDLSGRTWHVVQHEGFHQFAHAVIRGEIPIWANEGLAEYFGEGIWTGDGFQTGVIPVGRLKRIKETMDRPRGFMPIMDMMNLSHAAWNGQLKMTNYDQAWAMVHFLAHGEDGRYQKAFSGFMRDIGRGLQWQKAWQANFGDAAGFEHRWRAWWKGLPERPTTHLYINAAVSTLTSFLGRATAAKQGFDSFDEFSRKLSAKELKIEPADWLPWSLAEDTLPASTRRGTWTIEKTGKQPTLVMEDEDGTRYIGSFVIRGRKVSRVTVDIDDLKPTLAKAAEMVGQGPREKEKARRLVQDALRKNPNSPNAAQARQFMVTNR